MVARFRRESLTRLHCSPPSQADLSALEHAFELNERTGDQRRRRLFMLTRRFRLGLRNTGLAPLGGCFPVQGLRMPAAVAVRVFRALDRQGIRTLVQRPCSGDGLVLSVMLNARHTLAETGSAPLNIRRTAPRSRCASGSATALR